jgi:arsenate reductase
MKKVIFACIHNAGRSQMGAAFFNQLCDQASVQAISAGTNPASSVHPEVARVMTEAGVDLTSSKPQKLTEDLARESSLLVTMGCQENCPYVPGLERLDWSFEDPKGKTRAQVVEIRDQIKAKIEELLRERGWEKADSSA